MSLVGSDQGFPEFHFHHKTLDFVGCNQVIHLKRFAECQEDSRNEICCHILKRECQAQAQDSGCSQGGHNCAVEVQDFQSCKKHYGDTENIDQVDSQVCQGDCGEESSDSFVGLFSNFFGQV